MKCYYYLSPSLAETEHISDDLQRSGVSDWFIHIISRNEAGLHRLQLRSCNYLETMDFMRTGFIGVFFGFLGGLLLAGLFAFIQPFSAGIPTSGYIGIIFLITCFGAWQGGLIGISKENKKIQRFHDDIDAGKYLILVYAHRKSEEKVREMMERLHPRAVLVGYDSQFFNPFAEPTYLQKVGQQ